MERVTAAIVLTPAAPSMSAAFAEPKVAGSSAGISLTPSSGPATSRQRITPNSKNAGQERRQAAALKKMTWRGEALCQDTGAGAKPNSNCGTIARSLMMSTCTGTDWPAADICRARSG